jgi:hypothetical protein
MCGECRIQLVLVAILLPLEFPLDILFPSDRVKIVRGWKTSSQSDPLELSETQDTSP